MKNLVAACFYIALCLTIIGCTQSELQKTVTVTPTTAIKAISTVNSTLPTVSFLPSPDYAAVPTIAFNTLVVGTPTPYHTPDLNNFQKPYFEPIEIPGLLQSHLTIETLAGLNGTSMQRISGWRYGFKSLEWMDANHLLLYPYAGIYSTGGGRQPGIFPAVANLGLETFWIPLPTRRGGGYYPTLPRWSAKLGVLITAASDNSIAIHNPDGTIKKNYDGNFLGVSPSGTKLLIDDTWIDLSSEKAVHFTWQQTEMASSYIGAYSFQPIWSPDESRVYACCYVYGDATTSESSVMPYYGIAIDGENENYYFDAFYGTWVLDGKYMLPIWGGAWDGRPDWVSLFDPAKKNYRNLSVAMDVPYGFGNPAQPYCNRPSAQNGGRYVWVDCQDDSHLIDLATFHSKTYPPFDRPYGEGTFAMPDAYWSADGNFVWFAQEGAESILSAVTGEMKLLPKNCGGFEWHPKDSVLLTGCDYGESLLVLDPRTLSVQKQVTFSPNKLWKRSWSPDGKHIVLRAEDNSLWQIDYPNLDNLEQLTSAMPELTRLIPNSDSVESLIQNVVWAPDNSAIAFIGAQDIYIVQTNIKP